MDKLKLIPIGGIGGVTKNMYLYEYKEQILIVDCGIGFPNTNMLGVDILIPDISYLKGKEHQIVGMILTHAHDDHIAALPYILPQLPPDLKIYGSKLTIAFAQDRLRESKIKANFIEFPDKEGLVIGDFDIESVKVTHSVPDCRHYAFHTPEGTIYHGSDFKFDLTPVDGVVSEYNKMAAIGDEGVMCLLSDCLRSERETYTLSESIVRESIEREIKGVKGKLIVTVMSSNVHRIQQVVDVASEHGRKVAFLGRSVEQNVRTASKLGFFKLSEKSIIHKRKIDSLPADKVCIVIAGSQGQPESSLARAAQGDHTLVKIGPNDKVVFSSEPIPGNEDNVYTAIDAISKIGADVSYSDVDDNLHVSGHASAIEQKQLMEFIKPQYLVPIGGTYRHMIQYRKLAVQMKFDERQVYLLEDGQTLEFKDGKCSLGQSIKLRHIMVDGTGVGDVGTVVLNDRKVLADSGIVLINIPIDKETKMPKGDIQVISRGFVFMKESQALVERIKQEVFSIIDSNQELLSDWNGLRRKIEQGIGDQVYQETQREPLIMPVTIEV